ncbi:glycosyltransferase [Sphingomonas abietis]|uniref:Glycosyltransferase n=1 Tax=Sphingomonas abietis TaxID=3012344 RepID=A0ABY7NJ23_9SPHN|nr:glycosyltransferase family 2 protein [Sphingomonas abietis]WBO21519.1 glycosyltransferase [Sphingomonas abietis]
MRPFCVCVPARNEAKHIATLIDALSTQTIAEPVRLALCVNNSDDDTLGVAQSAAEASDGRVVLDAIERAFPPPLAHAGSARRAAMELGAERIGDHGLLISTDADCRPPPAWIVANLASAAQDELIVGGRIDLDDREPAPPALFGLKQRFDRYWEQVRAIEDAVDPLAWDPAPRHGDHTGASLALGVALYRRASGVPLLATGEDRALVEAAIAVGGRLVHPVTVSTRVSARTVGRAADGMALEMRRWIEAIEDGRTPLVPAFDHWRERADWRRRMRAGHADVANAEHLLPAMPCDMALPER